MFYKNWFILLLVLNFDLLIVARERRNRDRDKDRRDRRDGSKKRSSRDRFNSILKDYDLSSQKNIVVFMSDDQDAVYESMSAMPKTQKWLSDQGTTFDNAFVTTPICCPSRSTYLTGKYMHNHGVSTNNQECCSDNWRDTQEKFTFNNYLSQAGYYTSFIGKYMNEYSGNYVPPGWDYWTALHKNSKYYNYTLARWTGSRHHYNRNPVPSMKKYSDQPHEYFTTVIADEVETLLKLYNRKNRKLREKIHEAGEATGSSTTTSSSQEKPLLMYLNFPAPHGVEHAPATYQNDYLDSIIPNEKEPMPYLKLPHRTDKAYNYTNNHDKNWFVKYQKPLTDDMGFFTDLLYARRMQTLKALDDSIDRIIKLFAKRGLLNDTYFIYTSDHGYHLGQLGIAKGKSLPYDFDTRVPFYIRGPNIKRNQVVKYPITNIDLAPTILDLANLGSSSKRMDGKSIKNLVLTDDKNNNINQGQKRSMAWRDSFLVERGKDLPEVAKTIPKKPERIDKYTKLEEMCEKKSYKDPCLPKQIWYCTKSLRSGSEMIDKDSEYVNKWEFRVRKCKRATGFGVFANSNF